MKDRDKFDRDFKRFETAAWFAFYLGIAILISVLLGWGLVIFKLIQLLGAV